MSASPQPAVWFPAIRAGTGADVFTETLATQLQKRGLRTEIAWLPLRAEYAPWSVPRPKPPVWANVIHVNSWLSTRFLPTGFPIVATMHHCVHDPAFRQYKSFAQAQYHRFYIRRLEQRMIERAAAVTTESQFTAERMSAEFGPMDVQVIPLGIDANGPYQPGPKRLPHKPFRLIFAGTGSRRKGVDLLGPVMERLGPDFVLIVAGTSAIGKSPLPANICVKGRLRTKDELADLYRDSDAVLFPSRLEGFGLVAAEGMACGLPVIATRGSSLTEVVEDGVTGILCPQDDIDAFVAAARKLAVDTGVLDEMSHAARQRVLDVLSIDRMVDSYIRTYVDCNPARITTPSEAILDREAL